MSTNSLPPGEGSFRPDPDDPDFNPDRPQDTDHMKGWNNAVKDALHNFGRDPQDEENTPYDTVLTLTAKVAVTNPGNIVEYGAKFA